MPREGTIPGPVTERIEDWVSAPEARTYTSHQRSLHHIAPPSVTETGNRAISLPPPPSAPNCRKQSLLTSPRASSAQGDPWPHTREGEEVITDLLQSSPGRSVKIPPSGWWTYMGTRATPRILETSMWSNFANKNTEIQRNENTRSSSHSGRTELHLRNRKFGGQQNIRRQAEIHTHSNWTVLIPNQQPFPTSAMATSWFYSGFQPSPYGSEEQPVSLVSGINLSLAKPVIWPSPLCLKLAKPIGMGKAIFMDMQPIELHRALVSEGPHTWFNALLSWNS